MDLCSTRTSCAAYQSRREDYAASSGSCRYECTFVLDNETARMSAEPTLDTFYDLKGPPRRQGPVALELSARD